MKALIRKLTPESLLVLKRVLFETYSLIVCTWYDFRQYATYSSTYNTASQERMLGKVVLYYHVLEKGLSFENSRSGFGVQVLENLIDTVNKYVELRYDTEQLQFKTACSVIQKYFDVNTNTTGRVEELKGKLNHNLSQLCQVDLGGTRTVTKSEILKAVDLDFKQFFNARHSIREFSDQEVDKQLILDAIDIAKKYPSVCNRQAIRTYLIASKGKVMEHLSYQNGNRGFRDKIDKVIVVTADLSVFSKAEERNQPFIDGGIYLMGLLLSLHSQGLGAVALNWSTHKKSDQAYRKLGTIKESEVIISFVGIGHLKEKITVPKSERNSIKDTLMVIE
ncbi:nitroreductase family protein [Vibrio vulnificus]|nr:nitroreductase family protein [Vibrio vulnificus]